MVKKKAPKKEKKYPKKIKKDPPTSDDFDSKYQIVAYFDGSCSFGKLGFGYVLIDNKTKKEIYSHSNFVKQPKSCSSVAEYLALSFLMVYIQSFFRNKKILITGDSKMACDQMNGIMKINNGRKYSAFAKLCKQLHLMSTNSIDFLWRPREFNQVADDLSKCY